MDVMQMRRNLLMMPRSLLPSEYQQVEYIYSESGKIDLNYVPTIAPIAIITIMFITTTDKDIMGFVHNNYPSFIIDANTQNNSTARWYNRYGSTNPTSISEQPCTGEKHTWEFGEFVKYDGTAINSYGDVDWSSNVQSFNLLGARTNHTGIRVYDFKLYDGESLIRNLVPCYRKSDNVVGFYDTVSKTFFTSPVGTLSIPA